MGIPSGFGRRLAALSDCPDGQEPPHVVASNFLSQASGG